MQYIVQLILNYPHLVSKCKRHKILWWWSDDVLCSFVLQVTSLSTVEESARAQKDGMIVWVQTPNSVSQYFWLKGTSLHNSKGYECLVQCAATWQDLLEYWVNSQYSLKQRWDGSSLMLFTSGSWSICLNWDLWFRNAFDFEMHFLPEMHFHIPVWQVLVNMLYKGHDHVSLDNCTWSTNMHAYSCLEYTSLPQISQYIKDSQQLPMLHSGWISVLCLNFQSVQNGSR